MNPLIHRAITATFVGLTPEDINSGNCFNWAWIAHNLYPHSKLCTVRGYGGHAFIELAGTYYDAQHPNGVKHWSKLKGFGDNFKHAKPYENELIVQTKDEFSRLWKRWGIAPMKLRVLSKATKQVQLQFTV